MAIGCLLLLSLQEIHEGYLYLIGERAPGFYKIHSAWMILLVIFSGIGIGLLYRSRIAWWFGLLLMGGIAVLHLGDTWESIRWTWRPEYVSSGGEEIVSKSFHGFPRTLAPFEMFWLCTRNVLLSAVPAFLLLGEVRKLHQHR